MTRRQLRKAILALALIAAGNGCAAAQESASSQEARYGAHFGAGNWLDFVVYAPEATAVDLLLYDDPRSREASRRVPMQRSGDDWKVKVRGAGIGHGLFYMYRASGPREASPERPRGALFNPAYVLNDPYAYRTGNVNYEAFFSGLPFTDMTTTIYAGGGKSAVYDHSRDRFPGHVRVAPEDLIVYELHVQDYTATLEGLPADPPTGVARTLA